MNDTSDSVWNSLSSHRARGAALDAHGIRPDETVNLCEGRVEGPSMPLAYFHVDLDWQAAVCQAQVPHLWARQVLRQAEPHDHRRPIVLDPQVAWVLQA